jgi:hypothetical protein
MAIGLVLTFAVVAVIVSSVTELLSGLWRLRAHALEMGIARLLDDQRKVARRWKIWPPFRWPPFRRSTHAPTTKAVLQHPLIRSLSTARAEDRPPSYINAVTFATAFLGTTLTPTASLVSTFTGDRDRLDSRIEGLSPGEPGDTVRKEWEESGKEPAKLVAALLADDVHGVDGLAKLMGSANEVEQRVQQLVDKGDPAAAPISNAWQAATGNGDTKVANFVRTLKRPELVTGALAGVQGIKDALTALEQTNPDLGKSLSALWDRAGGDFGKFRHEIEDWFDRGMARVSGWYTRWSQWIMVGIALAVAFSFNISAITIGKALWNDPTLRDRAAAEAERQVNATSTTTTTTAEQSSTSTSPTTPTTPPTTSPEPTVTAPPAADTLREVGFPIGWSSTAWPGTTGYLALHILGIVLVAIAASFGAPFWFDVLNKFVNLRTTGKPPPKAAEQRAEESNPTP